MLQIAIGGFIKNGKTTFFNSPIYYEPGFTTLFPLELSVNEADFFYVLIRERSDNTGNSFKSLPLEDITANTTDATRGSVLTSILSLNTVNTSWDGAFSPLVLKITATTDTSELKFRSRSIDFLVKNISSKAFISFRVLLSDSSNPFSYLSVSTLKPHDRLKDSLLANNTIFTIERQGGYVIFTPFAAFRETTEANSDFSYPFKIIHYEREKTVNDENYSFAIDDVSHDVINENVSLFRAPQYGKAGVLTIDGRLRPELKNQKKEDGRIGYIDIEATGEISGNKDTFRIYLTPERRTFTYLSF